ncbi:putative BTB/POZ domain-containing protein 7 [Apostichopus japonicus]|uniref:Putative BTB/POZ domain-containing protein 7 n=1 Tax=Stichopus japonicus TaxID=307972 RepID=A0A2G8KYM5_STIJA|nr:putative BTB/POZ domain-containing protein 7 [Apostichopus japonicus]
MGTTPSARQDAATDTYDDSGGGVVDQGSDTCAPSYQQYTYGAASDGMWQPNTSVESGEKVRRRRPKTFSSLKRKIVKRKNSSKIPDSAKSMRDMLSHWNPLDVHSLVEEYEALTVIKDLAIQADKARPIVPNLKRDLLDLYTNSCCCDVKLRFKGILFPAHRAILSARCSFFRHLLRKYPGHDADVSVDLGVHGVTVEMFAALLRYLYTADFNTNASQVENFETFLALGERFGTLNPLEVDFVRMLESKRCSDAVLIFSSGEETPQVTSSGSLRSRQHNSLRCHRAILAARSPFFRNLLQRREHRTREGVANSQLSTTQIVLDESVIPKKYAHVLLHALYRDIVDLSFVLPSSPSIGSLGEAQDLVSGRPPVSRVEQAMELYQIAQFLELSAMAQGCEDYICSCISTDNLMSILHWSSQPHGSSWVWRQAMHFLREEFISIAASPVLFELHESLLIETLRSDFVQASEADILKAIIKWGEYQLIRRMEEREPNLLSNTQHSVSRKGIKRRDLNTVELRDLISNLLPLIRCEHILPASHEVLTSAVKRGLVSTPPSCMLSGSDDLSPQINPWVVSRSRRLRRRPRLYMPFVEEAKACLEEEIISEVDPIRLRDVRMSYVPDTLYMLDNRTEPGSPDRWLTRSRSCPHPVLVGTFPTPDETILKAMLSREKELQRSDTAQRAFTNRCTDSVTVAKKIQVRVVREFGLPDEAVEVFDSAPSKSTFTDAEDLDQDEEVFRPRWNEPPDLQLQHEPPRSPEAYSEISKHG